VADGLLDGSDRRERWRAFRGKAEFVVAALLDGERAAVRSTLRRA